jgi:Fic family protein
MAVLRTVIRGEKRYFYLVQTFRRSGDVHRKERYLGTMPPKGLKSQLETLERDVWRDTWFAAFQSIREGYQAHLRSLPEEAQEKEREQFIVEFTHDTNRIEGSSLTLLETADLITRGISPSSKPMRDIRETQLHAGLLSRLLIHPEPVDFPHLLAWHKEMFGETKPDLAGRIRDFEVRIQGSKHIPPPPLEARPMLIELVRRIQRRAGELDAVERAALFHVQFENIHPFGDGNGRLGRLAMNLLLLQADYPMLNIPYVRRKGYYHALERASVLSSPQPFLLWLFRRYLREGKRWSQSD